VEIKNVKFSNPAKIILSFYPLKAKKALSGMSGKKSGFAEGKGCICISAPASGALVLG
jgi:hypothetical protein